jgi:hypothetical protein
VTEVVDGRLSASRVLDASRLPIEDLTLPQRVARFWTQQEAEEDRQAEARRYQRQAELEAHLMQTEARQRLERYMTGHTSEQLAEWKRQQTQERDARIEQLERELARLRGLPDPDLPQLGRAQSQPTETEALIARSREVSSNPLVLRMVREFDERQELRRSRERQAEIRRLEQAVSGQAEITRAYDTPVSIW